MINHTFKDRVAVVTGASQGIGKSIAEDFANHGARVCILARNYDDLMHLKNSFPTNIKNNLYPFSVDLTQEDQVDLVVKKIESMCGGIDILVNNLGGAIKYGNLLELRREDWQNSFDLNVMSMVFLTKTALPLLKKAASSRIINISSLSGLEPGFYNPHYSSMKAATINFTKYLANTLAQDNILVNAICPGPVISRAVKNNVAQTAVKLGIPIEDYENEFMEKESSKIPLGRFGRGEDISRLVLFLAGDHSSWVTGSCFHVNGGKLRSMS